MTSHFLVCPFDEQLLIRLGKRSLVIRADSVEDVAWIAARAPGFDFHVHALLARVNAPLASIDLSDEWQGVPIALHVPRLGPVRGVILKIPTVRNLNIRIYLPDSEPDNYAGVKILSSLGVPSAIQVSESGNWGILSDLMAYAYFGLMPHADIEPFKYLASSYGINHRNEFGTVYFEDPARYLHLDRDGHVALTHADLARKVFVADSVEEIHEIESRPEYLAHTGRWRHLFMNMNACSTCPGWRVCLGKFPSVARDGGGCREFFTELIDSVEKYLELKDKEKKVWQP